MGFVERADRKRRHLGLGFERRDWPEAAPSWIRFRASGLIRSEFLSFPPFLALLGCSFIYIYKTVVGLLALEGVSVWEGRVVALLLF